MAINYMHSIEKTEGDWKVFVNPRPYDWNVEIFLVNRQGKDSFIANIDKDGFLKMTLLKEGATDQNKPFMVIPRPVWQLLVDAITETTPPSKKERIEGELEATRFHLEDLRKLLKLK